jgi:cytochrome bd-type quinol oxidase subunit 2
VLVGLLAGMAVGILARAWMRLIADDPAFTWGGTIFIVAAFTIVGAGHGVAWAGARAVRRSTSTMARLAGAVATMALFVGAGAVMLPTVVGGALAAWRRDWRPGLRLIPALPAVIVPLSLMAKHWRDGLTAGSVIGLGLFVVTYALVIASLHPVVGPRADGWRMSRTARHAVTGAGLLAAAGAVLLAAGVPASDL